MKRRLFIRPDEKITSVRYTDARKALFSFKFHNQKEDTGIGMPLNLCEGYAKELLKKCVRPGGKVASGWMNVVWDDFKIEFATNAPFDS